MTDISFSWDELGARGNYIFNTVGRDAQLVFWEFSSLNDHANGGDRLSGRLKLPPSYSKRSANHIKAKSINKIPDTIWPLAGVLRTREYLAVCTLTYLCIWKVKVVGEPGTSESPKVQSKAEDDTEQETTDVVST